MADPISEVTIGPLGDPTKYTLVPLTDEGSYGYGNGSGGPHTFVTYKVEALEGETNANGRTICDLLMGVANFTTTPMQYPQPHIFPGSSLRCLSAEMVQHLEGTGPDPQLFGSPCIAIRAEYGTTSWNGLDYDVDGTANELFFGMAVPWSSLDVEVHEEEYETTGITAGAFDLPVKRTKIKLPITEYQIGRSYIPFPDVFIPLSVGLAGKINSGTFLGAAAGNVLMSAPQMRNHWDPTGGLVRTFLLTFRHRPIHWNYVLEPKTVDNWILPQIDGVDVDTYSSGDFNALLQYGLV